MPKTYEEFHEENNGSLKQEFEEKNPTYWGDVVRNPKAVDRVLDAQSMAEAKRAWLTSYHEQRFQEEVGREVTRIWEERTQNTLDHPAPPGAESQDAFSHEGMTTEARRRVSTRFQREIASIDRLEAETIEHVAEQERIAAMTQQEKEKHFKAELHQAVDGAQEARTQARRLFAKDRERLLDEARENGSENPERDVSIAHAKVLGEIDRQEHKDLHALFGKYGWSYDKQAVEFSEQQDRDVRDRDDTKDRSEEGPSHDDDKGPDHDR